MGKFLKFLLLSCLAGSPAYATEPLHDLVTMDGKTGFLFPDKCCWVKLPSSDKLDAAKLEGTQCSAIGGPVGNFELADGKLLLRRLRACDGDRSEERRFGHGCVRKGRTRWAPYN